MAARAPAECPVCGEPVPRRARACPHCGADERSGWNEDETRYDGLDLPDEAFGVGDGRPRSRRRRLTPIGWVAVAVLMALVMLRLALR